MPHIKQESIPMLRSVLAAAFALFAIPITASTTWAENSTDGIVIYSPIEGVSVITVSTAPEDEGDAAETVPAVNVVNQVSAVSVVGWQFWSLRCGIGVPYPSDRIYCGDPLYPLW
jgi:hypothetical protein